MNDLIFPIRDLTKKDFSVAAERIVSGLLENRTALEAWVIGKQLEAIAKEILSDNLKEKALLAAEKTQIIFGAEVQTKRSIEYEYEDDFLNELTVKMDELKEKIKKRKTELELAAERGDGVVDTETGAIGRAKKIKDGLTLTVTFPR